MFSIIYTEKYTKKIKYSFLVMNKRFQFIFREDNLENPKSDMLKLNYLGYMIQEFDNDTYLNERWFIFKKLQSQKSKIR